MEGFAELMKCLWDMVKVKGKLASKTQRYFENFSDNLHVSFNGAKCYRRSTFAKRFPSREIMTERYDLSKFGDLSSTYSNSLVCRLSSSTNVKLSNYGKHARLNADIPPRLNFSVRFLSWQKHMFARKIAECVFHKPKFIPKFQNPPK